MKNRLELAKRLLSDDGVMFVQCDDNEQAYLKVLMDEVFGRENYLNTVIVKAKASSGASGGGEDKRIKKNAEFLLIYSSNNVILKTQYVKEELIDYITNKKLEDKSFAYNKILLDRGKEKYIKTIKDGYGNPIELYELENYSIKSVKEIAKEYKTDEKEVYYKFIDKVFTTENAQTSIRDRVKNNIKNENLVVARYKPVSGKNKDKLTDVLFIGETKRLVSFLHETVEVEENGIYKLEKIGTLWSDISWSSINFEGNTKFGSGQKPEKLIHRIIDMSTNPNDLVLDFHLGSGTTCAVAHKMGRRYIGIEQMDYIEDITVERLKKVIEGEQGGISKSVNWQGGGSFIYCELLENSNALIRKIQSATEDNINKIKEEIYEDSRIVPYITRKELKDIDDEFEKLSFVEKQQVLIKLINKNKLYVNYSDIDDSTFNVTEEDKTFTKSFYDEV